MAISFGNEVLHKLLHKHLREMGHQDGVNTGNTGVSPYNMCRASYWRLFDSNRVCNR